MNICRKNASFIEINKLFSICELFRRTRTFPTFCIQSNVIINLFKIYNWTAGSQTLVAEITVQMWIRKNCSAKVDVVIIRFSTKMMIDTHIWTLVSSQHLLFDSQPFNSIEIGILWFCDLYGKLLFPFSFSSQYLFVLIFYIWISRSLKL